MPRAPFLMVEGDRYQLEYANAWLKARGFDTYVTSADVEPNAWDHYLQVFHTAQNNSTRRPTAIVGHWLSDQVDWSVHGQEFLLPLAGRVFERLANRYQCQRVLLVPHTEMEAGAAGLVTTALGGRPIDPDVIPEQLEGHLTYLAHLLAHQVNHVPGWTVTDDQAGMEEAIRLNRLARAQAPAWVWEKARSWYGVLDPRVIIVGDRFNPAGHEFPYPFGKHSDSSVYLNTAINLAALQEWYLAFININDPGGPDHLARLFSRYVHSGQTRDHNPPTVVALGREAGVRLNELGFGHADLPHPQWVKRFHHDHLYDYGHQFSQFRI